MDWLAKTLAKLGREGMKMGGEIVKAAAIEYIKQYLGIAGTEGNHPA
jgi:hypothetical protein